MCKGRVARVEDGQMSVDKIDVFSNGTTEILRFSHLLGEKVNKTRKTFGTGGLSFRTRAY